MIDANQLKVIMPKCPIGICDALARKLPDFEVNTRQRIAAFISQVAHESNEYSILQENLFYHSADRLMQVWPRIFHSVDTAKPYTENPAGLANFVYANRNGNGNEASGDGWNYRGRFGIQRTGRNNYQRFMDATGINVIDHPELLLVPEYGVMSDLLFWKDNNLNNYADDVLAVSRGVNLGNPNSKAIPNGMSSREAYYHKTLAVLPT